MSLLRRFVYRCRALFCKGQIEREMAEEMRFHLEERMADRQLDGLEAREARLAAQRQFGNLGSIQEKAREARGWTWLENLGKDLRLGGCSLRKSPGFVVLAIVTLGLGIGANTSIYSMLNSVLLKPLPYPDTGQLDRIYRSTAQDPEGGFSAADYLDMGTALDGYGRIAAYSRADLSLAEPGQPAEMAAAVRVSSNLFSVLGIPPQMGRDFRDEEARQGNHRVLIISRRCWLNRFGGAPDIIGRTVRVDGESHEIVGVMPATFNEWRHLGWVDLFRPLGLSPQESTDRTTLHLQLIGRRSSSITPARAEALMASFGKRLATDFPEANAESAWRAVPLHEASLGKSAAGTMSMLVGLSCFVLLIACSNLANFLLARTMSRAREFAVRSALGASRSQLLRPLIAESLLLAWAGGMCAILVAYWFSHWLSLRSTGDNGEMVPITIDWSVLSWALVASLFTAVAFGLGPALFALRLNVNRTLKSGARGSSGGLGHRRLGQLVIVGQFALAMVLLAGAGLWGRSLNELNNRRAGWESDQLVTATVLLPAADYPGTPEIAAFQRLTLERLAALPGVKSASLSYTLPFFGLALPRKYQVQGLAAPKPGHEPAALINGVSPQYFETVGTRLLLGRAFNDRDTLRSPKVFIINQTMSKGLFGTENPLGRSLARLGGDAPEWGEIVGVAADIQSIYPEKDPVAYQLYQPLAQEGRAFNEIAVRTNGVAPSALVEPIRTTMTALHPDLPLRKLQPADARIERVNYQLGVLGDMLSLFAALGLGLASLGIYGVMARTMAQRSGEFGIRLALGATVGNITRLVLTSGVRLAVAGAAIGLLGAFGISRILAAQFPGMRLESGAVIAAVSVLLMVTGLIASYLPARRAARINPIEALRAE